ncbi:zf-HC2 domain-containing protein [Dactylosporangium sp. CA-092794]|uniref:zf-HC2 domain-containing protein n=1 Tax=Dactylosporangium sp. CA-092794 TaxID=3239929 RepID=UPI003D92FC00
MTDSAGDPHVRDSLGLYLLGELAQQERDVVERHLATCPACQVEADELVEVLDALVLLSDEEGREVVEAFGVPVPAAMPVPSTQRLSSDVATVPAKPPRHPGAPPPRVRPSGGRPAGRPSASRRRRLTPRSLLGLVSLALIVVISAGVFVGLTLSGPGSPPGPVDITLAATAQDTTTGAHLSVLATGHDDTVTIQATVTGLHHDTQYQLYVVTSDGKTHVVTTWTGSDAPQQISGEAAVSTADLSFFTVTLSDGTPVVSAYVKPAPTR